MSKKIIKYPEITPRNIWNFRQNNPQLVIDDAKLYLGLNEDQCAILRKILMARGVNKWLKVRRDLIAYKKQIKHEIKVIEAKKLVLKDYLREQYNLEIYNQYIMFRELSKLLQRVRRQLRELCNTDRWQIWPITTHHNALRSMNTLRASD